MVERIAGFCDLLKSRIFLFSMVMTWGDEYNLHIDRSRCSSFQLILVFASLSSSLLSAYLDFNLEVLGEHFPILAL
jgi:hypothetical protein